MPRDENSYLDEFWGGLRQGNALRFRLVYFFNVPVVSALLHVLADGFDWVLVIASVKGAYQM